MHKKQSILAGVISLVLLAADRDFFVEKRPLIPNLKQTPPKTQSVTTTP